MRSLLDLTLFFQFLILLPYFASFLSLFHFPFSLPLVILLFYYFVFLYHFFGLILSFFHFPSLFYFILSLSSSLLSYFSASLSSVQSFVIIQNVPILLYYFNEIYSFLLFSSLLFSFFINFYLISPSLFFFLFLYFISFFSFSSSFISF